MFQDRTERSPLVQCRGCCALPELIMKVGIGREGVRHVLKRAEIPLYFRPKSLEALQIKRWDPFLRRWARNGFAGW